MNRRAAKTRRTITGMMLATAAVLGGAAVVVKRKKVQAERQHPPAGKFVELDGVHLHYVERGTGPTLVLLHGNFVTLQDFTLSPLFELAAAKYRVIVFDRPGFGYSQRPRDLVWTPARQAELLHRALLKLGIDRPYVMGHSWGTFVALELALHYPSYVAGVVLASGNYYATPRIDSLMPAALTMPVIGSLLRHTIAPLAFRAQFRAMLRILFSPAPIPEYYRAFPVWLALRPAQLRASSEEGALLRRNAYALRGRLETLAVPTAIVAGSQDRLVHTEKQSVRLHRELPATRLRVVEGAGHMVHHTTPQAVMAAIDALATAPSQLQKQG